MNLKQLEVLKAVMETGSTVGAAGLLKLSQSAISRHLTALEAEIGFELFIRDKGRLVPRPEARALVPDVAELTAVLARVKRKADDLRTGSGGATLLRVAFPHSMTTTVIPGLLTQFMALRPRAVVEVLPGPYGAIEQMIHGRSADLGFVRLPTEDHGFSVRPLLRAGTTCVMAKTHPLAGKARIELKDLARSDLILLGRQRTARNDLEAELRSARAPHHCRIEVHSVEAACACAAAGLGVAVVPTLIASLFTRLEIEMRPFHPARLSDYGIITLPDTPLSRAAEDFVELFAREIRDLAPDTTPIKGRMLQA
jgi:DNA-binding transcriptional LysR family regulator